MTDTDKLRPEVQEALDRQDRQEKCDEYCPVCEDCEDKAIIRAELLRLDALARELNEERGRQAALRFDERIRAEKAEAELAALRHENAQLHDVLADRDMDREMAAHANRELAALKARIAESQECDVVALCGGGTSLSHEPRESLVGKRVRLLLVTTTEDGPTGSQPASRTPDPAPQG